MQRSDPQIRKNDNAHQQKYTPQDHTLSPCFILGRMFFTRDKEAAGSSVIWEENLSQKTMRLTPGQKH